MEQRCFRAHRDGVSLHVFALHIDGRAHRKTKSFALASRVADRAFVASDHVAVHIQEITLRVFAARVLFHEVCVIAIRNEADILRFLLMCIHKSMRRGVLPDLRFGQSAERKDQAGQLFLREHVQHIALVFGAVGCFAQDPPAALLVKADLCIVPGRQVCAAFCIGKL